ncbi:MAG TPA: mitochondrial fission ELM1 family protein [Luteimonas sp.]|nr:mitochondrial fission ELM1 family protein [Luteimonas sp.]
MTMGGGDSTHGCALPGPASPDLRIAALSDGRAGNARQATALAAALGAPPDAIVLDPRAPWRWAAPRRLPGDSGAFGQSLDTVRRDPPALAIGCGRQAALATRLLRGRGRAPGTRSVQILDPRLHPRHWDLVVVPEHDRLRGANVLTLLGSLHPVDAAWLARARAGFDAFAALPRPRTALLVGGPSAHMRFDAASLRALLACLAAARRREGGGSVLATTSRRTPPALAARLRDALRDCPGVVWTGHRDGANPYPGLLAWADRIVCTADSVNMISEACATTVPVFVAEPQRVGGGPRRFVEALRARGRIRALDDALVAYAVEPLLETARIAAEVRARLAC